MVEDVSYTTEEVAQILKVSKLTVYDLIKKGELPAYRVGRQMRVEASDLDAYKSRAKSGQAKSTISQPEKGPSGKFQEQSRYPDPASTQARPIIISGQDVCLDILASHLEKKSKSYRPLRSYAGSLDSLLSMYNGESDVVSTHLLDGDTGDYNVPYIRKILVGHRYLVVNLVSRWAGFYVSKGNPKQIHTWTDLLKEGIQMVNREKGSGARVMVDEQFRIHGILAQQVRGYESEETNHLGVAGTVARGEADVGIGIEKAAHLVGVDFISLLKERYDLVMLKSPENMELLQFIMDILQSKAFQAEIRSIGGYDLSETGKIIFET